MTAPVRVQPDDEPQRADLMPASVTYRCPACGAKDEFNWLTEDASGEHRVSPEDRFRDCEDCGAHLDIGWAGWRWHDADAAPAVGAQGGGNAGGEGES
ncbi:hypothetical protein ACIU1J_27445 [Azospirillum doebereinerae]|uniref:hypothetical protein n=1 Tax=Azospirillum doebereinerae TaxID=92933 RepID=UPI001EE604FB|nr:hypothetical protein [Azospirillum doebereinerae]MCG5241355.1 hypothetical protein [Azospirillum doebereinerae]